jgi:Holliday junction DNA helicase RuvA
MIGRLRGLLVYKRAESVLMDVNGVGYELAVTPGTLAELPRMGEEIVLATHLYVREDQLALFGFTTSEQRDIFRLLLGLSGVGPRVALAMLATLNPDELRRVVATEDVNALTIVPGIGKRTAQKLMLELRAKLDVLEVEAGTAGPDMSDVREALSGLGYSQDEIREAMRELPTDLPLADLLKLSLQELGKQAGS